MNRETTDPPPELSMTPQFSEILKRAEEALAQCIDNLYSTGLNLVDCEQALSDLRRCEIVEVSPIGNPNSRYGHQYNCGYLSGANDMKDHLTATNITLVRVKGDE